MNDTIAMRSWKQNFGYVYINIEMYATIRYQQI